MEKEVVFLGAMRCLKFVQEACVWMLGEFVLQMWEGSRSKICVQDPDGSYLSESG
jgi:hypothetical protein